MQPAFAWTRPLSLFGMSERLVLPRTIQEIMRYICLEYPHHRPRYTRLRDPRPKRRQLLQDDGNHVRAELNADWLSLGAPTKAVGPIFFFDAATNLNRRFYRARRLP
jgi:hypothetical protein